MRIWFKLIRDTRLVRETTVENGADDTRTHKIFAALEEACTRLDLGHPIWLDRNIAEFKRHSKTRFHQDNFVETVDFDYLEMEVLDED